jgi:zinc transporter ZupT
MNVILSFGTGYLLVLGCFEMIPRSFEGMNGQPLHVVSLVGTGAIFVWLTEVLMRRTVSRMFKPKRFKLHKVDSKLNSWAIPVKHRPESSNHGRRNSQSKKSCCNLSTFSDLPRSVIFSAIGCIFVCAFFDGVSLSSPGTLKDDLALKALIGGMAHFAPEVIIVSLLARGYFESKRHGLLFCGIATALFIIGGTFSSVAQLVGATEGITLGISAGVICYIAVAHLIPKFSDSLFEKLIVCTGGAGFFFIHAIYHVH